MTKELRFDGKVAIVTGAGGGLGKAHALLFGKRGAKVVVNDLGGAATGGGKSSAAADAVVAEIKAAGGEAVANYDSVEDGDRIVKSAVDAFGRVDIVVNNAGILRDTSFQKMSPEDWDLIYRVHVLGSFRVTHAAWNQMRDQGYGRIVMTASAAGIYGNFGQANYSMAKLGLVGFANTLAIEGKKKGVHVNTIAPIAGSRLTETILPKEITGALRPEYVSPLVAWLCHEDCTETGGLFEVGGGFFAKLRWERANGHTFRVGRAVTPEALVERWGDVAGFAKTTHPADVTQSMQPILENLQAGPSKGGNALIDVDQALGHEFAPIETSYKAQDLSLYALAVGACQDPLDESELPSVYELHPAGFRPLPSFAVVPAVNSIMAMASSGQQAPGLNYGFERILHGEQSVEIKKPLAPSAKLTHKTRIKSIFDKGKNAVVVSETRSFDESGDEVFVNETSTVVRGAGGWGGDRGPAGDGAAPPAREPDAVITEKTGANQALFYRLLGDWNPLHVDPAFAQGFGFQRPILHGLCFMGYAARHVLKAFAKGDGRLMKSMRVRFADSVFPGETLRTEMWRDGDRVVFQTKVVERDKVCVSNAVVELWKEVPKIVAKAKASGAGAGAGAPSPAALSADVSSAELTSADIFVAVQDYLEKNPAMVAKVQTVFGVKLTSPDSAWTIDAKNGSGAVTEGTGASADVTLELCDADWRGMAAGQVDPQKLYFGGKLKIGGNLMAAQKLEFLKKVDPAAAREAILKARAAKGGGAGASAGAGSPDGSGGGSASGDIFLAIRGHLEDHPEMAGKIATVFGFKLTGPDSTWTVDVKNGKGSVSEGLAGTPDVTLELSNDDFVGMATGKLDAQKLYFGGKLKLGGNMMAAQKLEFLKKIDPDKAKAYVLANRGSSGGSGVRAPSPVPSTVGTVPDVARAPAIFEALTKRLADKPALAAEVGALLQFRITGPDGTWVVDGRGNTPSVKAGTETAATTTLEIADADLVALAAGTTDAKALYQHGKLRVTGDVRGAHKLGFLKGLVPGGAS